MQRELADVLVRMGCLSSAVEVLSRLEMWEELALCYQGVGRKAKAIELVQGLLDKQPTPGLLCLMGDITEVRGWEEGGKGSCTVLQNADCYEKAWELSACRSSRAQKSLGLWYLRREQYAESVACLQKSLAINSMQAGT